MMKIAILGDSVAWGQGLAMADKYWYQVAAALGADPDNDVIVTAHSGAIIGVGVADATTANNGEVPFHTPTILEQIAQVPNPGAVDLVLLNGGINDVGVDTIIDPFQDLHQLNQLTDQACFQDMSTLLGQVLTVFTKPGCRFVVTGYYPILSADSELEIVGGVDVFGHLLGIHGLGFPLNLDHAAVTSKVCRQALAFWQTSEAALARAATAAAQSPAASGRPVQFVSTTFAAPNALFASQQYLFAFGDDLAPEDEVIAARERSCDLQYPDPLDFVSREQCYHASVGHPNVQGAAVIAQAIKAALGA
jgi:lysophospholipase L1-like esterase